MDQWSDGIVEGTFFQREIEQEFEDKGVKIPLSLLKDFDNRIYRKRLKKHGLSTWFIQILLVPLYMKRKVLQYLADYIIERLEESIHVNEKVFYFYLEMGLWLDYYSVSVFDVYLN